MENEKELDERIDTALRLMGRAEQAFVDDAIAAACKEYLKKGGPPSIILHVLRHAGLHLIGDVEVLVQNFYILFIAGWIACEEEQQQRDGLDVWRRALDERGPERGAYA